MPDLVVRASAALIAVAFAWAAAAKLVAPAQWRSALKRYELPAPVDAAALVATPLVEIAVAVAIVVAPLAIGGAAALIVLAAFSLAILQGASATDGRLPCGCFGRTKARDYKVLLARNAALGALAAIATRGGDSSLLDGASFPRGAELVPAALVVAGVGLGAWLAWTALRISRDDP